MFFFGSSDDTGQDFLAKTRAAAADEHISFLKYLAGMLKHALRGHDLSKIHFYPDDSGDTDYESVLDKRYDETIVESAPGLITICHTKEESDEHFRKLRDEVARKKKVKKMFHAEYFKKFSGEYQRFCNSNPRIEEKIDELRKDTLKHPAEGLGKPERFKHSRSITSSRHIGKTSRLAYTRIGDTIYFERCRGYYDDH
jgi:toxin YoeB